MRTEKSIQLMRLEGVPKFMDWAKRQKNKLFQGEGNLGDDVLTKSINSLRKVEQKSSI